MSAENGVASGSAICAAAAASTPSHITGAIAGAASRFAGSDASETSPKCSAISGAVPTVAAIVIAAASATGPGIRRSSAARNGGAPGQQRGDRRERQLPSRLARRARVEDQRERRREQQGVPAPRRPPGERGEQAGDPHHPGSLDRRPRAGQRHVEHDHRGREREPRLERDTDQRARREHEDRQQHHVLAADREDVRETRRLEVVLDLRRQPLVLTEHHSAQQRRLGRAEPAVETAFGGAPHAVERAEDALPALAGRHDARRGERGVGVATSLIGVVDPERLELAADDDDVARPPATRARASRGRAGALAGCARRAPARRGLRAISGHHSRPA